MRILSFLYGLLVCVQESLSCKFNFIYFQIVLCDECNYGYHMMCLDPPLSELPEEDWYCPSCKRDTNNVVAPGAAKQTKKSSASKSSRDWGRGMACVGKCSFSYNIGHNIVTVTVFKVKKSVDFYENKRN